jgi:hypothetical protein
VDLCNLIIAEEPAAGFTAWDERPDEELLAALVKVQAALGVSKQAAWERFSGED